MLGKVRQSLHESLTLNYHNPAVHLQPPKICYSTAGHVPPKVPGKGSSTAIKL